MNIAGFAMNFQHQKLSESIGVAVTNMAKDRMEQQGEGLEKLLGAAAVPPAINPGSTVDVKL